MTAHLENHRASFQFGDRNFSDSFSLAVSACCASPLFPVTAPPFFLCPDGLRVFFSREVEEDAFLRLDDLSLFFCYHGRLRRRPVRPLRFFPPPSGDVCREEESVSGCMKSALKFSLDHVILRVHLFSFLPIPISLMIAYIPPPLRSVR